LRFLIYKIDNKLILVVTTNLLQKDTIMTLLLKTLKSDDQLAPTLLRIVAGIIFAAHGAQKLFAWFGGIALIIGLLVRPSVVVLAITMLVALFAVHFENGLFMANNGYEFALSLLVISIALAITGAGRFNLDNLLHQKIAK
jgi:putative oxidoreductase